MAPSQHQHQPPTLQQALAVAVLLKRRCKAAVADVEGRCAQLEQEVDRLRAAAEAPQPPPPPQPPLAALVAPPRPAADPEASSPGPPPSPSPNSFLLQQECLAMWHHAPALLPPDPALQQALAAAQRYVVLKELGEGPACGLPATAALERSPVRALLELAGDILQAHAAAEAGSGQAEDAAAAEVALAQQAQQEACPLLSPEIHAPLLAAAATCAVQLCEWPGQAAVDSCYGVLQQFCGLALHLAASPPPPPAPPGARGSTPAVLTPDAHHQHQHHHHHQQQQRYPDLSAAAAEGAAAIDFGQPTCHVAHAVLSLLHSAPSAGMVLLSCAAPNTRDCVAALAASVLGEPQENGGGGGATAFLGGGGGSNGSVASQQGLAGSSNGTVPAGALLAAFAEEAGLLHAFALLSQQLSAGLRQLPQWVRATGMRDDVFLQEVASSVMAARDAAQLISLTHPAVARQMQRVAAQMMHSLQQLAGDTSGG